MKLDTKLTFEFEGGDEVDIPATLEDAAVAAAPEAAEADHFIKADSADDTASCTVGKKQKLTQTI